MPSTDDINKQVLARLKKRIKGKTLILGVGNPMRGDDGAGPLAAEGLKKVPSIEVINCRDVPEKYTKDILKINPDTIIIIDTVDFKGKPGQLEIIEIDRISETGFSTHEMALVLLAKYVKSHIDADIFLLGIKAQAAAFNTPISAPVRKSIDELIAFLSNALTS